MEQRYRDIFTELIFPRYYKPSQSIAHGLEKMDWIRTDIDIENAIDKRVELIAVINERIGISNGSVTEELGLDITYRGLSRKQEEYVGESLFDDFTEVFKFMRYREMGNMYEKTISIDSIRKILISTFSEFGEIHADKVSYNNMSLISSFVGIFVELSKYLSKSEQTEIKKQLIKVQTMDTNEIIFENMITIEEITNDLSFSIVFDSNITIQKIVSFMLFQRRKYFFKTPLYFIDGQVSNFLGKIDKKTAEEAEYLDNLINEYNKKREKTGRKTRFVLTDTTLFTNQKSKNIAIIGKQGKETIISYFLVSAHNQSEYIKDWQKYMRWALSSPTQPYQEYVDEGEGISFKAPDAPKNRYKRLKNNQDFIDRLKTHLKGIGSGSGIRVSVIHLLTEKEIKKLEGIIQNSESYKKPIVLIPYWSNALYLYWPFYKHAIKVYYGEEAFPALVQSTKFDPVNQLLHENNIETTDYSAYISDYRITMFEIEMLLAGGFEMSSELIKGIINFFNLDSAIMK